MGLATAPLFVKKDSMSFTDNPYSMTDRMRLTIGDTDPDNPLVSDTWYTYFYEKTNNENSAAIEVAKKILALYSGYTREREAMVEVYGSEKFQNYLEWLRAMITDSALSVLAAPMPYASGTSVSDMQKNEYNPDNVRISLPFSDSPYSTYDDPLKLRD